ncbi:hypothetical protein [Paenibacillus puerhi]|uniref:hypothetical protein n=1 Tax=Paenibacillus puerhi TaxID=2692622 RepID=UPI001358C2E8|nr:hypothetical protein [Paenibacillus puerhi]
MNKIYNGWFVITATYFVVYFSAGQLFASIAGLPSDRNTNISGLFMGACVIVFPYVRGGIYANRILKTSSGAFWVSFVPVVCEKILLLLIGTLAVMGNGDGTSMIWGLLSIVICMTVAKLKQISQKLMEARKRYEAYT